MATAIPALTLAPIRAPKAYATSGPFITVSPCFSATAPLDALHSRRCRLTQFVRSLLPGKRLDSMASCASPSLATNFTSFRPMVVVADNYYYSHSLNPRFSPFLKFKPSSSSPLLPLSITSKTPRKKFQGGIHCGDYSS